MKRNGGEFGANPIGDPSPKSYEVDWKGNDLRTTGMDCVILPGRVSYIPVLITPDSLPPNLSNLNPDILKSSTKSKLAQSGLESDESNGKWIAVEAKEIFEMEGRTRPFEKEILVKNHGMRPIKIEGASPLFRLYVPGSFIEGEDLKSLMESDKVSVDGKRGKEWEYIYHDPYSKKDPYAIAVRIGGKRLWIPQDGESLSVREIQAATDYREFLAKKYKPVPTNSNSILWIGETVKIHLGSGIDAELEKTVFSSLSIGRPSRGSQIAARLIDGEKTEWEVRVEVLGPTDSDIANYVVFRFMHSNGTPH